MAVARWYESAWIRLGAYFVIGCLVAWYPQANFWVRGLVGWIATSTIALIYQGWMICHSDAEQTRYRASLEDPGRTVVWVIILGSCLFSLAASVVLMGEANVMGHRAIMVIACLWAVMSSWFLTHTSFTLRYAHLYYREDGDIGGLQFPGGQEPDDWDFAYYAFTIGMCFQASDVSVSDRSIRRTTLLHALLSFFYNTAILALTFNLIMGHLGNLVGQSCS